LGYIVGRQTKGFVAVAVESDEWQTQRGPRSEFKTGCVVFQSCLCPVQIDAIFLGTIGLALDFLQ